jgi:urease accessory protein UreF
LKSENEHRSSNQFFKSFLKLRNLFRSSKTIQTHSDSMLSFSYLILKLLHAQQTSRNHALLHFTDGWNQTRISVAVPLAALSTTQCRKLHARCRVQALHTFQRVSGTIHGTFGDVISEISLKFSNFPRNLRWRVVLAVGQNRDNRHFI